MTRTLVTGGGIAGLATAALLAQEGHQVKLLERNSRLGGRVGLVERDGFRFDTGPSWYLMPRVFDHFFEMLGTSTAEQLDLKMLDPGYQVLEEPDDAGDVRKLTIPHGLVRVVSTFEQTEAGSGEVLRNYLASARHASDMAEQHFLYNPFTRLRSLMHVEVLRNAPRLVTLLGSTLERFISKRFQDPLLRQVLGYPAVFLGTDPSRAPAMYHLMSALDLDVGVQYPMGGFWHLVERLEALAIAAGVEIVLNAETTQVLTDSTKRGFVAKGVQWRDSDGNTHVESADIVVSGADLHHTETALLPPEARSYPESWWEKKQSGPGAIVALLGIKGELPQLEHHNLFFTRDWDKNFGAIFGAEPVIPDPASIYVCKPSATDPSVAPSGHENLFVLIPVPADVEIGEGGVSGGGTEVVEQTADHAIGQIAQWSGISDLRQRIVMRQTIGPADFAKSYHSWKGGMLGPSHILRQSAMFRAQNKSKRVENLFYAGGTTAPGIGVPMCLISAELVLKRIRGDHSPGPLNPRLPSRSVQRKAVR